MNKNGFFLVIFALFFTVNASATKIYHCKTTDGRLHIQDFPCKAITLKVQTVVVPAEPSTQKPASQQQSAQQNTQAVISDQNNGIISSESESDNFYGMPIHPRAIQQNITDNESLGVITLTYISTLSSDEMVEYYLSKLPEDHNRIDIRNTIVFIYFQDETNKLISIKDVDGVVDITLQIER